MDRQVESLAVKFAERFGRRPRFGAVAPGRVNLIGEHTDYNDGYALPMAIDRHVVLLADPSPAGASELWAVDLNESVSVNLAAPPSPRAGSFGNYLPGVADQFAADHHLPNLDAALSSTIPIGAGLAGSAALEVAMAITLARMLGVDPAPARLAAMWRRAEYAFAGTPCGIMDMLAVTHARRWPPATSTGWAS